MRRAQIRAQMRERLSLREALHQSSLDQPPVLAECAATAHPKLFCRAFQLAGLGGAAATAPPTPCSGPHGKGLGEKAM